MNTKDLPAWFTKEKGLKSYFENSHGERWIAVTREDVLIFSGADIDWEMHRIDSPDWAAIGKEIISGGPHPFIRGFHQVVMSEDERLWLLAVCSTRMPATGTSMVFSKAGHQKSRA